MSIPANLRPVMARLAAPAQSMVSSDYERRRKSKFVGYLAWFFLGWHYLYLRRVGLQFAFWITLGGFGLWWFVDLFRVGPIVNRMNEDLARNLISQYQSIYRDSAAVQIVNLNRDTLPLNQQSSIIEGTQNQRSIEMGRNPERPTITLQPPSTSSVLPLTAPLIDQKPPDTYIASAQFSSDLKKIALTISGAVAVLIILGIFLGEPAQVSSDVGVPIGVEARFNTTGLANVRDKPSSKAILLGSIPEGQDVTGVPEFGPNGIAKWVRISSGTFKDAYVSGVNLEKAQ
jgi:TM2 domain-containing membrane protein YozV